MTNYNERLDKVLSNLYNSAWIEGSNYEDNNPEGSDIPSKREIAKTAATKQALTSLIKEMVAEAKPDYCDGSEKCNCKTEIEQYINSGKETAIIQFEQNLLKALEEV